MAALARSRHPEGRISAEERVFAFADAVGSSLDLEQTRGRVARALSELFDGVQCLVCQYDAAAERLYAVSACGSDVERLLGTWMAKSRRAADQDARRHLRAPDSRALLVHGDGEARLEEFLDLRQAAVFPMAVQRRYIGQLLCLAPDRQARYSAHDLRLGRHAASLAAHAINNAQEHRNALRSEGRIEGILARMSQLREQERKVFSGLIHDDVLQAVVGSVYALESLRESVAGTARADFDHVVHMLRLSMDSARRIIWEVRPSVLEGLGLEEALCTIADRIAVQGPATVTTHVHGADALGDVVSSAVYKIGREALLNAERHAHARAISLSLVVDSTDDGPILKLVVEDDGLGFNPGSDRPHGHFGLVVMREQADATGGHLTIESSEGKGARVELTVPLFGLAIAASGDAE